MSESQETTSAAAGKAITVPLNDDGTIGTLPDQLQKLIDSRIREATKRAAAKSEPSPVEVEELRRLQAEKSEWERREAERKGEYEKALHMREAEHAKKLEAAAADVARRTERLKASIAADIRAAALEHGARKESLDELGVLLSRRVTLDDATLASVVLSEDGQPSDTSIADLVKAYLDTHPHHRAAPVGGGGAARGGSSMSHGIVDNMQAAANAAMEAWARNPTAQNYQAAQAARAAVKAKA